ncbi:MAG: outer membrane homotrimeric porin [Desulfovibrio sp.]|uniref:outer membrane homotrimeric porin n=1 Tax=Desulfovibrio sp. TaxID=885 RepID=UPI001A75033B|nr:outer membrane homotrimeric porin [Desulfovibrio sp.]MBD5417704.1 outer membrane homotrimeric porin [Desulfovibrio sp.]
MKKIATLLLAAGLVFGAATGASAIDFKAKGQWVMSFDYGQNGAFVGKDKGHTKTGWNGKQDDFEAQQRVRLQLDAVASEALSGTVYFEIGTTTWGQNSSGGALGADAYIVKLKNAYIDWMPPETDLKVRMGIQNITTPAYASGNSVLNDDVAGIVANYQVNEMVGITAFWARPYNDNFTGYPEGAGHVKNWRANYMDNMDAVGLMVPLTLDGAKVTPWGMYAGIGPNTFRSITKDDDMVDNNALGNIPGAGSAYVSAGLFPAGGPRHRNFDPAEKDSPWGGRSLSSYGNAWWGGISSEITIWDPFRLAFDFEYGSVTWEDDGRMNRQGWFATLLAEYKLDWAIPGIYGWYSSGDDANPANGSERLPSLDGNNTNLYSTFAFAGEPYITSRDGRIGVGMAGTWGIGARLKDMSFIEDLKHTFRVNYIGGTNSTTMAKKMSLAGWWANQGEIGMESMYLTTGDSALEFGLTNTYKMYDNFTIQLDADYIALWLDTSTSAWGARHKRGDSIPQTKDAWNINASFVYSF